MNGNDPAFERLAQDREEAAFKRGVEFQKNNPSPKAKQYRDALKALVERIAEVGEHPEYRAAWKTAQLHRGPYSGPTYEEAYKVAEELLR